LIIRDNCYNSGHALTWPELYISAENSKKMSKTFNNF
jgi:hypothetical protein